MLDTRFKLETPEAIEISVSLAGVIARTLAYSIDLCIRTTALIILFIVLAMADRAGIGLFLIISFLLEWFYPVFFEVWRHGKTPGKKAMGLAVIQDDLTPVTFGASMIRNILRFVDFLPMAYTFGIVAMIFTGDFKRLGDLAAGTLVVYTQREDKQKALSDATPSSIAVELSLDEQEAFVAFAERAASLSTGRQQELADILSGVDDDLANADPERVKAIGMWLVGGKQ